MKSLIYTLKAQNMLTLQSLSHKSWKSKPSSLKKN